MALNLDISKLTQAGARKPTAHDNCIVLDLGTGPFPRDIEVRLPDDDGARQNALWDGSLNLAVNDEVLCFEYSGISAWRVMAMGGNDGGAGKARVSEIWESDFGAVALETDASGNVTLNGTRTLTIPTDLIHAGDADTKFSFADDKISLTAGGLLMIEATEIAGQDTLDLGDVAGGGDVDIDFNDGQMLLRGSDGNLKISGSGILLTIGNDAATSAIMDINGAVSARDIRFYTANSLRWIFRVDGAAETGGNVGSDFVISRRSDAGALLGSAFRITRSNGFLGINLVAETQLDVNQSSTTIARAVLQLRQADVDEPFTKFQGVAASADLTRSIVDDGDVTTATLVGWTKIEINDIGNQVADGDYFTPFYSLA